MSNNRAVFNAEDHLEEIDNWDRCLESNIIPEVTNGKGEGSLHALPFFIPCDPKDVLGAVQTARQSGGRPFPEEASILVAGNGGDRNVRRFLARVKATHVIPLLTGATGANEAPPSLTWALGSDKLWIDRTEVRPRAAFVRYCFHPGKTEPDPIAVRRTHAWHAAVSGWLAAHPDVRTFNRHQRVMLWHKPAVLHLAAKAGLSVPETVFGNDVDAFLRQKGVIKPIDGRGYCQPLDEIVSRMAPNQLGAQPVVVQERLDYAELRVYAVGRERFAVSITSDELDYRTAELAPDDVRPVEVPEAVSDGFDALLDALGLDFCAADFKTRPGSPGEYVLLDVNDAPMFADCDQVLSGALTKAMLKFLLDH